MPCDLPVIASSLVADPATQRDRAVLEIQAALTTFGCFELRIETAEANDPVGETRRTEAAGPLLDAAVQQWRRFYAQPDAIKQHCQAKRDEGGGWLRLRDEPVYSSHMNPSERDASRCKEQFGCSATDDAESWPSDKLFPGFRRDVSACARFLDRSARQLLSSFEALLGQEKGFLRYEPGYLTLTSYPAQPAGTVPTLEGQGVGLHAHSDAVVFTMLQQSEAALEVQTTRGDWWSVPVLGRDSLLVIPGDWLELFTNGQIKAVRHRVLEIDEEREAVVYFQNVASMQVGPLEHFLEDGASTRYPTVSSTIPYSGGDAGVPRWRTITSDVPAASKAD